MVALPLRFRKPAENAAKERKQRKYSFEAREFFHPECNSRVRKAGGDPLLAKIRAYIDRPGYAVSESTPASKSQDIYTSRQRLRRYHSVVTNITNTRKNGQVSQ
jgi:hypothetical protein